MPERGTGDRGWVGGEGRFRRAFRYRLRREYFSTFKRIFQNPELLTVAPDDFVPRLRSVFSLPPDVGAEVLHELVHETYDLIERQFPDAKVDWWRSTFDHERTFWEEDPLPIR